MDCLFCKIADNKADSLCLYEDDLVKVILDAFPDANGHTLIIPKKHFADIDSLEDEYLLHINKIAIKIKNLLINELGAKGIVFLVNYGKPQVIKHYHLHLLPVYDGKQDKIDRKIIYDKLIQNKDKYI